MTEDLEQVGMEHDIEQRAVLYQLVETLPEDQRRVIIRRFAGQKSLREIAADWDEVKARLNSFNFGHCKTFVNG